MARQTTQVEVSGLKVEFSLAPTRVHDVSELVAEVVFTNVSGSVLRLNTLILPFQHVLLKTRREDGTEIPAGPPGFPPEDDGKTSRVDMQPKESATFTYSGAAQYGNPLPPGKYQMRFRWENQPSQHDEWTGLIETKWLDFEVRELRAGQS